VEFSVGIGDHIMRCLLVFKFFDRAFNVVDRACALPVSIRRGRVGSFLLPLVALFGGFTGFYLFGMEGFAWALAQEGAKSAQAVAQAPAPPAPAAVPARPGGVAAPTQPAANPHGEPGTASPPPSPARGGSAVPGETSGGDSRREAAESTPGSISATSSVQDSAMNLGNSADTAGDPAGTAGAASVQSPAYQPAAPAAQASPQPPGSPSTENVQSNVQSAGQATGNETAVTSSAPAGAGEASSQPQKSKPETPAPRPETPATSQPSAPITEGAVPAPQVPVDASVPKPAVVSAEAAETARGDALKTLEAPQPATPEVAQPPATVSSPAGIPPASGPTAPAGELPGTAPPAGPPGFQPSRPVPGFGQWPPAQGAPGGPTPPEGVRVTAPLGVPPRDSRGAVSPPADSPRSLMDSTPPEERKIVFNFKFQPWGDVLEWFAERAGLSLVMEGPPHGTFNYSDRRAYTISEAIDLINSILLTKGYTLVRRGQMLILINLEDGIPPNLVSVVPQNDLDQRGEWELVCTLFQLSRLSAEEAQQEIRSLLGPQGSVVILPKAQQLLVTDTAGRLRVIREVLERADSPEGSVVEAIQSFSLQHVTPDEALAVIRQLLGIPADQTAAPDGSLRLAADLLGMRLFVSGKASRVRQVAEILKAIDVPGAESSMSGPEGALQLEVYDTAPADPQTVLQVAQTLLAGSPGVRLATDPKTGHLVALARPSEHATIRATIDQLRRQTGRVEVIPLRRLDPQIAAAAITKLLAGQDGKTTVKVEVDLTARQLLVRGTEAEVALIRSLLEKMGEGLGEGQVTSAGNVRILPVYGPAARQVVERLEQLWPSMRANPLRVVIPSSSIPSRTPAESGMPATVPSAGSLTPGVWPGQSWGGTGMTNPPAAESEQRGWVLPADGPGAIPWAPEGFRPPGPPGGPGWEIGPGDASEMWPGSHFLPAPPPGGANGIQPVQPLQPLQPVPIPPGVPLPEAPGAVEPMNIPPGFDQPIEPTAGRITPRRFQASPDLREYPAGGSRAGGRALQQQSPVREKLQRSDSEGLIRLISAAAQETQAAPSAASTPAGTSAHAGLVAQVVGPPAQSSSQQLRSTEPRGASSAEGVGETNQVNAPSATANAGASQPGANAAVSAAEEASASGGAVSSGQPVQAVAPPTMAPQVPERAPAVIIAPGPTGLMIASEDEAALDLIEEIVRGLAGSTSTGPQLTIFYLKHAKANAVAEVLDQVFGGGTLTVSATAPTGGNMLRDLAGAAFGEVGGGLVSSLLGLGGTGGTVTPSGTLRITPDSRLNALIVQATPADLEIIEQLLRVLDQKESPEEILAQPKPRLVPVRNMQAEEVAQIVREVYQDRLVTAGGGQGGRPPNPQEFIQLLQSMRGGGRGGTSRRSTAEETQRMSIGVDPRTNSVIVAAPEPLFQEVKELIEALDRAAERPPQATRVVTLHQANPESVQQALTALLGDSVQFGRAGGGTTTRTTSPGSPPSSSSSSDRSRTFRGFGFPGGFQGFSPGGFPGGMMGGPPSFQGSGGAGGSRGSGRSSTRGR